METCSEEYDSVMDGEFSARGKKITRYKNGKVLFLPRSLSRTYLSLFLSFIAFSSLSFDSLVFLLAVKLTDLHVIFLANFGALLNVDKDHVFLIYYPIKSHFFHRKLGIVRVLTVESYRRPYLKENALCSGLYSVC